MKKILFILCASALALVSCEKQAVETPTGKGGGIVFNLNATHPDSADTKAVKTSWETGDVIYVFFSEQVSPRYLEMNWNGAAWVSTAKNSLNLEDAESGTMRAVYLPFGNALEVNDNGSSFTFSETQLSYYLTATLSYTVSGGEVSGTFNMQIPEGYVQFFLDDTSADPTTAIELRERHLTPQGIASIAADGTIVHTSIAHGAPLKGYVYDKQNKTGIDAKGWLFSGILEPAARNNGAVNYVFTLVSGGWQGDYHRKIFTGNTLYTGTSSGRAIKLPAVTGWTPITDYKPIDLNCDVDGKRIYWSSRNLGANADVPAGGSESDRRATWGDYYAWGVTEPNYKDGYAYESPITNSNHWKSWAQDGYSDASYPYTVNTSPVSYARYTGSDYTVLQTGDDAAFVNTGGIWRMPTKEECSVLQSSCSWSWDGFHKGYNITTNGGTAWTDPTIFLPTAGNRGGTTLFQTDEGGWYYSSSYPLDAPTWAWSMVISSEEYTIYTLGGRWRGYSIRPVTD